MAKHEASRKLQAADFTFGGTNQHCRVFMVSDNHPDNSFNCQGHVIASAVNNFFLPLASRAGKAEKLLAQIEKYQPETKNEKKNEVEPRSGKKKLVRYSHQPTKFLILWGRPKSA